MSARLGSLASASLLIVCLVAGPVSAQEEADPSDVVLRLGRLEEQVRQLSGQIEELQHANRRLEEQVKLLQGPTGQKPIEAAKPALSGQAADAAPVAGTASGTSATNVAGQPLNLMSAGKIPAADAGATPARQPGLAPAPMTLSEAAGGANAAPAEPPKALSESKSPLAEMRAMIAKGSYDRAVVALNAFVEAHPDDPDVAEAVLLTGDAHFRQKHFQDAAQDYLKLAKTYPSSPQAPLAFVKLGDSLVGMGQKDQACQTYGEFLKRFTDVDAALRARAERSRKGAGC